MTPTKLKGRLLTWCNQAIVQLGATTKFGSISMSMWDLGVHNARCNTHYGHHTYPLSSSLGHLSRTIFHRTHSFSRTLFPKGKFLAGTRDSWPKKSHSYMFSQSLLRLLLFLIQLHACLLVASGVAHEFKLAKHIPHVNPSSGNDT